MAEMKKAKTLDIRTKTYILLDQRDYPKRLTQPNTHPTPINICDIAYNVRKTVESLFDEMDEDIIDIQEWLDIDDFDFEEDDMEDTYEKPKKVRYLGMKPRKTRRPIKNFLRTVLHIKRFKSDAELEREEAAIRKLVEMNPERPIKIYSMDTLLSYIVSHPGVTVSPCHIMEYLNVDNIRTIYGTYTGTKNCINDNLARRGRYMLYTMDDLIRVVEKIHSMFRTDQETYQTLDISEHRNVNMKRKMFANMIVYASKAFNELYDTFGRSFWEFKLLNDDAFNSLYDFLGSMISDFCKLNPTRPPNDEC